MKAADLEDLIWELFDAYDGGVEAPGLGKGSGPDEYDPKEKGWPQWSDSKEMREWIEGRLITIGLTLEQAVEVLHRVYWMHEHFVYSERELAEYVSAMSKELGTKEREIALSVDQADGLLRECSEQLEDWELRRCVMNERTRRFLTELKSRLLESGAIRIRRFGVVTVGADPKRTIRKHELTYPASDPPDTSQCIAWAYLEARAQRPTALGRRAEGLTIHDVYPYRSGDHAWAIEGDGAAIIYDLDDPGSLREWNAREFIWGLNW